MPRYRVTFEVIVEADDEEDAIKTAEDEIFDDVKVEEIDDLGNYVG